MLQERRYRPPHESDSNRGRAAGVDGMNSDGPLGRYRDRVSRDADDIAGFFSTRAGAITAGSILAAAAIGLIYSLVSGWIG